MAGGVFSTAQLFGMTIRESATDGSDFTNPAADYRRLFLGEDGRLHVRDSAGVITGIGATQFCRKTADESKSSTSYADSTSMTLALEASCVYSYRFVVLYNTNATSVGIKLAIKGPASCLAYFSTIAGISAGGFGAATMVAYAGASGDISTDLPCMEPTTGPGASPANTVATIEGIVSPGATAGNLILRHASETATATTILINSFGLLTRLA